jgi:hypothetical protein
MDLSYRENEPVLNPGQRDEVDRQAENSRGARACSLPASGTAVLALEVDSQLSVRRIRVALAEQSDIARRALSKLLDRMAREDLGRVDRVRQQAADEPWRHLEAAWIVRVLDLAREFIVELVGVARTDERRLIANSIAVWGVVGRVGRHVARKSRQAGAV